MNLFINACTRKESRTLKLAKVLLNKLGDYETIDLYSLNIKPIDEEFVNKRNNLIKVNDYNDQIFDLAKKVSQCENIIIAAPYWDLSFPSILKVFVENIYCVGIVSSYDENGKPYGLCKGKTVYYVTTAGGPLVKNYGYEYIKDLFINYFGFEESKLIYAEMLDVIGFDSDKIIEDKIKEIEEND